MASVTEIIDDARSYASSAVQDAEFTLALARSASGAFQPLNLVDFDFDTVLTQPTYPDPPSDFTDFFRDPAPPGDAPTFETLYLPELPDFPDPPDPLDTSGLFNQEKPVFDITPFSESDPDVNVNEIADEIDAIIKPALGDIEAPTTTPLNLPDAPSLTLPEFSDTFQGEQPGDVDDLRTEFTSGYAAAHPAMKQFIDDSVTAWQVAYAPSFHTAQAQLETKIADDMADGRAMSDAYETALYERARMRAEQEKERLDEAIVRDFERRGFTMPPGALMAARAKNQYLAASLISQQANELAIEIEKIELQHKQFVMQLSAGMRESMRGNMLQYAGILVSINGQAIDYAREIASRLAEAYNLSLARFQSNIDLYRVQASIFEVVLRGSLANLEEYRLLIEAEKLKKDAEQIDVQIYSAKIQAEERKIDFYLAQLRAVTEKANLEKLKVDVFREQVNAYVARVNGKEAEFRAYEAALKGDEARVNAQISVVNAYAEEVRAAGIKVDAEKSRSSAITDYNRNLVEQYESDIRRYEAQLKGESDRFSASVDTHRQILEQYKTELQTQLETFKIKYDKARLDLEATVQKFDGDVRINLADAENYLNHVKIMADTAISAGSVYASIASSALSSQNTMVSSATQAAA